MEENSQYADLQKLYDESHRIVFFGGAGVSTESGIPDFRSKDGLYHQKYKFPPEEIISHHFFEENPREFYRFYRDRMLLHGAKPNAAHLALAQMEAKGKLRCVITQNIDGLHQAAGSKRVYELHGSTLRNYCTNCGRFYPVSYIEETGLKDPAAIPRCQDCGGIVKPDVVLYEENLDEDMLTKAVIEIENADMLIIGGTSLVVYPAAGLIRYYRGDRLVLINRDATPADSYADLVIHDSIGKVLGSLKI